MPFQRLKDLFLPAWKQSNPAVRRSAVEAMTPDQHELLSDLILTDESPEVRLAAVAKLDDPARWEALIMKNPPADVRRALTDALHEQWRKEVIPCRDRESAAPLLAKINDEAILAEVAVQAETPAVRLLAIEQIGDEALLCRIAEQPCGKEPGEAAVKKITKPALLQRLRDSGANKRVRNLAGERLERIEAMENQPSPEELRQAELEELLGEAEKLSESWNWSFAEKRLKEIAKQLEGDDEVMRERLQMARHRFDERRQEFEERQAEEARQATARQAAVEARSALCAELEALASVPSADAATQEEALVARWDALDDGLPEEQLAPLRERFAAARKQLAAARKELAGEQARLRDLEALVKQAEGIAADQRGDRAEAAFQEILRAAASFTFSHCDPAPLQRRLEDVRITFREEQQAWREAREEDLARRQVYARELMEQFEGVFSVDDWRNAASTMRDLNQEWRELEIAGMEPGFVKECADRIKGYNAHFGDWLQAKRDEEHWERWANLSLKEELIKKVEALASVENAHDLAEAIKRAQAKWKEIGPVPRENAEEMWQRFHTLCNEQFARAKAYFDAQDKERQEHLEKKQALVARAEVLQDSTEWKDTADELKAMQEEWKQIGPAPREQEQEVYLAFRKVCDTFFGRLREHHEELDVERQKSLEKKLQICARAEELSASEAWWETINEISELHSQWKQAGPAPRKDEEEVWQRFQAATQGFFDRLEKARPRHLEQKQAILEEAKSLIAEAEDPAHDKDVADQLKALQARWKEVGPGPQEEEREVWKAFQETCDSFFETRREHFQELIQERDAKLEQKQAIVQRAREAAALEDKREAAEQLKALQQEWNEVGVVPFREDADLWQEFRGICNAFFEARSEAFSQRKQDLQENLKRKEALLARLDALIRQSGGDEDDDEAADAPAPPADLTLSVADQLRLAIEENFVMGGEDADPRSQRHTAFEEVKKIQADWREIGPVPRKVEQALWKRYRHALDTFFGNRRKDG